MTWDLQTKYDTEGVKLPREEMESIWKTEEPVAWERLQAFKEGRTGFPWIVRPILSIAAVIFGTDVLKDY